MLSRGVIVPLCPCALVSDTHPRYQWPVCWLFCFLKTANSHGPNWFSNQCCSFLFYSRHKYCRNKLMEIAWARLWVYLLSTAALFCHLVARDQLMQLYWLHLAIEIYIFPTFLTKKRISLSVCPLPEWSMSLVRCIPSKTLHILKSEHLIWEHKYDPLLEISVPL